jgi:hypothetical protein
MSNTNNTNTGDWHNMTLDELAQLITKEERVTPMSPKTIIIDMLYSVTGRLSSKRFNSETLEFDGKKIKQYDDVLLYGKEDKRERYAYCTVYYNDSNKLVVMLGEEPVLLEYLNVVAHYPAKDKELEQATLTIQVHYTKKSN